MYNERIYKSVVSTYLYIKCIACINIYMHVEFKHCTVVKHGFMAS